jgi:hypothetical protein
VADPAGRAGDEKRFRSIETLGGLVGRYCWIEHRIFEMTGGWASAPDRNGTSLDSADAERRVWCAAVSRRHGVLSARWRERLPLRAGVDRAVLVAPPPGPLSVWLEELAMAADPRGGLEGLVQGVLPGLAETYAAHLSGASAVSEGPVLEVLVEARREGLRDIRGGLAVLRRVPRTEERAGHGSPKWAGDIERVVERAFDEFSVFPAVRPS